jgi:hypothetical protein
VGQATLEKGGKAVTDIGFPHAKQNTISSSVPDMVILESICEAVDFELQNGLMLDRQLPCNILLHF